ncbi:MAG: HAMP domain-containing histidine kinase [Acetobacteraceae bacterium]|nr:HAMP domain-containing histidine kinase [Acetobacteraceae bacterium]
MSRGPPESGGGGGQNTADAAPPVAPGGWQTRPRRALSVRILLLTVGVVLLTEMLVFLPGLAWERREWLTARATWSHIAALSAAQAPGGAVDPSTREELLRLAGTLAVILHEPSGDVFALTADPPLVPSHRVDLRTETTFGGMRLALAALVAPDHRVIQLFADSPVRPGVVVEVLAPARGLKGALLRYARTFLGLALPIAALSAAFVYGAMLLLLVRPIRQITNSIVAFRANPERTPPLDPNRLTFLPGGEISIAGRELAAMQRELRTALWRNARLAALGAAIAKVGHDLRNVLSPALLSAERLEMHPEPGVRRSGATLVRAVENATEMVGRMLDFAREVPPQLVIAAVDLGELVAEAAASPQLNDADRVDNQVRPGTEALADRALLLRVVLNLLRNAIEAGATRIEIRVAERASAAGTLTLEIADDGPGLPPEVRDRLFRPFVTSGKQGGTGLGLAIAADLMRAQGGQIALLKTGGAGTVFLLTLPAVRPSGGEPAAGAAPDAPANASPPPPSSPA